MTQSNFLSAVKTENKDKAPLTSLQHLWQKIEKYQKRNANTEKKIAKLYAQFQQEVEPTEHKSAECIAAQISHLTQFITRKTLNANERNELLDWIHEDLNYLRSHPFIGDIKIELLQQDIDEKINEINRHTVSNFDSEELGRLREMIHYEFDGALTLTDEELLEVAADPSKLAKHIEKLEAEIDLDDEESDFFGDPIADDDEEDMSFFDDLFKQQHEYFHQQDQKEQKQQLELERLFKGSQLNKMYKRLAAKLHPDKEQDPIKKQEKHQLMQQLSDARKNKDGFTLLQLYLHNFDDDMEFDSKTMENLAPLLQAKIAQLNEEHQEIKNNNKPETLVWRQFNGRSKAIVAKNMAEHISALQSECTQINELLENCTTVKNMKKTLKSRMHNNSMLNFSQGFNQLFDVPF